MPRDRIPDRETDDHRGPGDVQVEWAERNGRDDTRLHRRNQRERERIAHE